MYSIKMKTKTNNSLLRYCHLPNDKIKNLGLSFRNIGKKCHNLSKKYLKNDTPINEIINNQKKLRRDLSNWVNDPKNVVDSKGKYIGDKYGARITICTTDGLVLHDVETFCRDVRNRNSRILGSNNNFVYFKDDFVESNKANKRYLYSTINVIDVENSNIKYSSVNAYKVKSSSVPSSDPNSSLMQYLPNETADGENVTIVSGEIMDDHTARKEIIQAACGRYGYAARASRSGGLNYYVCKYVEGDDGMSVFCRLSYFKFPDPTIIDVAVADGRFTTLVTAVKAAGLVETLSSPGPFTVFAPTDAAFSKLPAGTVQALLADVPKLTDILKYHVVEGNVMAADVVKLNFATTVAGLSVSVRVENGKAYINDSQVFFTNIVGSNGVIHVIDTVLLPQTIVDLLDTSKKFTTLVTAVQAAGLVETLSSPGPFTVFAPTDAAFSKLPAGTVQALLADVPNLTDILKYHVVSGKVVLDEEVNGESTLWTCYDYACANMAAGVQNLLFEEQGFVTTLADLSVSVRFEDSNSNVYINNSQVTTTEVVGSNGVIHAIDTVLQPFSLYEMMSNIQVLNNFTMLLDSLPSDNEFLDLLKSVSEDNDSLTVFAPIDSATEEEWLRNIQQYSVDEKEDFIKSHIVPEQVEFAELDTNEEFETLADDESVVLTTTSDELFVNGSKIKIYDIKCNNGKLIMVEGFLVKGREDLPAL